MAGAFSVPVDQVPPFFEPARVQMDFAPEREVASKHFLTKREDDEEAACADYATVKKGEFTAEGKPGWFFLAAAERASSENFTGSGVCCDQRWEPEDRLHRQGQGRRW